MSRALAVGGESARIKMRLGVLAKQGMSREYRCVVDIYITDYNTRQDGHLQISETRSKRLLRRRVVFRRNALLNPQQRHDHYEIVVTGDVRNRRYVSPDNHCTVRIEPPEDGDEPVVTVEPGRYENGDIIPYMLNDTETRVARTITEDDTVRFFRYSTLPGGRRETVPIMDFRVQIEKDYGPWL